MSTEMKSTMHPKASVNLDWGLAWYEEEELNEHGPQCPACGSEGNELGTMGNCTHYRCRNCGIVWSRS